MRDLSAKRIAAVRSTVHARAKTPARRGWRFRLGCLKYLPVRSIESGLVDADESALGVIGQNELVAKMLAGSVARSFGDETTIEHLGRGEVAVRRNIEHEGDEDPVHAERSLAQGRL